MIRSSQLCATPGSADASRSRLDPDSFLTTDPSLSEPLRACTRPRQTSKQATLDLGLGLTAATLIVLALSMMDDPLINFKRQKLKRIIPAPLK